MKDQDLPESENIEDRRDEPEDDSGSSKPRLIYDEFKKIADSSDDEGQRGGISDEGGYNDIPRVSKTQQVVGTFAKAFAAGGSVQKPVQSSLTRLTAHPIFPQVRIVHRPLPGLTDSSPDMKTVFINSKVPTSINVNGKRVPTAAPLSVFELYSRAGCEVFKETSQKHGYQADEQDIQTCARRDVGELAEKHFLTEQYGFTAKDWTAYCKIMDQQGGRKMSTGGPVLGNKDDEEEGSRQKNRQDRRQYEEQRHEEEQKDDPPPGRASDDPYNDYQDESHVG